MDKEKKEHRGSLRATEIHREKPEGNERLRGWSTSDSRLNTFVKNLQSSRLVSLSMRAAGVLPHQFLRQAQGKARFFWQDAQVDGRFPLTFAGFGIATQLQAWGKDRFHAIQEQANALFADAMILSDEQKLAAPRLFGGFAFRDDFTPDNTWSIYPRASFVLPHFQLVMVGKDSWLTINTLLPQEDLDDSLPELKAALQARFEVIITAVQQQAPPLSSPPKAQINYPLPYEKWAAQINKATTQMRATDLNKVVLARVCEAKFQQRVDVDGALDYLQTNYADCYQFLFEPRPYHAFFGASPELLAGVNGRSLSTMALAGSIARGDNRYEDELLAQELLQSKKDLYEHALVAESIRRRLEPITESLSILENPTIYRLHNIQHLYTPISGRLKSRSGILSVVEQLHPTPALGGSPRDLAMAFIREAEPVPRGWYAAPIGWIDHEGNGRFSVAIRSAVAQERRVWLYAGAGIVEASEPQKEWDETELKFRPMLEALKLSIA